MVRHIVMLQHNDGIPADEAMKNALKIKTELDRLKGVIPGIVSFSVVIDPLPTSNMGLLIDSAFENEEALAAYTVHPEHVRVLEFIKTVMHGRACVDYRD